MSYPPQPGQPPPYPPGGAPRPQYPNPGYPPQPPSPLPGYGPAYGAPYAGLPSAGYPPPYGPPRKSRKGLWVTLAVVVAVVAIAVAVVLVIGLGGSSDEKQIRQAINGFAEAVDTANTPKTLSYLCAEEARQIIERDDYDPNDTSTIDPIKRLPVNISDVHISGDTATARLKRPPAQTRTLRLKKEAGTWKLCNPGPP